MDRLRSLLAQIGSIAQQAGTPSPAVDRPASPTPSPAKPVSAHSAAPGPERRAGAELRILRVLAQRYPARLTETQWAVLSRMKRTGGTWQTYKSRLRSRGLIEQDRGDWTVTP